MNSLVLLLFGLSLILVHQVSSEACTAYDDCSCKTTSGKTLTLWPMANTAGGYALTGTIASTAFHVNPCQTFNDGSCQGVFGCQQQEGGINVGSTGSEFLESGASWDLVYHAVDADQNCQTSDKKRHTTISLICDESVETPVFVGNMESPACEYKFTLTHKCACPGACDGGGPPKKKNKGLSAGSILLIIFFVLLVVYFIAGIIIMKFMKGANGVNMVPNLSFWAALPGLIKEGVLFIVTKIKGCCGGGKSYDQI